MAAASTFTVNMLFGDAPRTKYHMFINGKHYGPFYDDTTVEIESDDMWTVVELFVCYVNPFFPEVYQWQDNQKNIIDPKDLPPIIRAQLLIMDLK